MKINEILNEAKIDPFAMDGEEDEFPEPKIKIKNIVAQLQAAQDSDNEVSEIQFINGPDTLSIADINEFLTAYHGVKNKPQMTEDASTSLEALMATIEKAKAGIYGFNTSAYSSMRPSTKFSPEY